MNNNKLRVFILSLLVMIFISCKDSFENEYFTAYEELPIGLTIDSWEDHSDWVKLLKKADLYNALNLSMKYTSFVASNQAVAEYMEMKGKKSVDDFTKEEALALMKFHVIAGVAYEFANFTGKMERETLSGDYLNVKTMQKGEYFVNEYAKIADKVIKPTNGRIYKMDKMLDPLITTVWDEINKERYSIFRDAALECGLEDTLQVKEHFIGNVMVRSYKTVFVVSDSIFKVNDISNLNQLKAIYPNVPNDKGISPLYNFIASHIVSENADWSTLATFAKPPKNVAVESEKSLMTYSPTELITVSDVKGKLLFNNHITPTRLITGRYDMLTSNGYVHEIDGLLAPMPAKAVYLSWELTNYDVFRALPYYRKYSTALDFSTFPVFQQNTTDIRWFTIPASDRSMLYYLRSAQEFEYNDAVTINLGNVGQVEFDIPIIPAGKYTFYMSGQRYNARGKGRIYFDDVSVKDVDFAVGGAGVLENLGTLNFTAQTKHVFKVVSLRKGNIDIDRIYFVPVK